ncbi:FkbM family methyltransferase [Flavobacteriaceae bacterium]|nr:FkbM family methyltransferase [Flavobacteriaceae bacterium]
MIKIAINFLKNIFLKNGILLNKVTSIDKLNNFFNRVKIFNTEKGLIRIGGNGDGGYLIPNDLDGIKTCFSPGVSDFAFFEEDLTNFGIKSFLADYSVDKAPGENENLIFEKKYLGGINDDIFMTLEKWTNKNCSIDDNDLILQMDIEGSEYDVILETKQELFKRFRIIVIEFHDLQNLFNPIGYNMITQCFNKLLDDFYIVHGHPNNTLNPVVYKNFEIPPVIEFTFIRKDRVKQISLAKEFPHVLDANCVQSKKSIILPSCWYN